MDRYELDRLATMTKKDKSFFPLLMENTKSIVELTVSRYAQDANMSYKDDYTSEAYFALFRCLETYDASCGAFASYASYAAKQGILDYMRNSQSMISVGSTKLNEIKKVEEAISRIRESGLELNNDNLRKFSGISSEKTLRTVLWARTVKDCLSLNAPVGDDREQELIDSVPMDCYSVEDEVFESEELRVLEESIFSLSKDDRFLIISSYGLYGHDVLTNREIASRLSISENTVVNRKKSIQAQLHEKMESWAS